MIGRQHPNINLFIESIKKEQQNNVIRLVQLQSGLSVNKKKRTYVRTEKTIQTLIAMYTNNEMSVTDFLDEVSKHLKLYNK